MQRPTPALHPFAPRESDAMQETVLYIAQLRKKENSALEQQAAEQPPTAPGSIVGADCRVSHDPMEAQRSPCANLEPPALHTRTSDVLDQKAA